MLATTAKVPFGGTVDFAFLASLLGDLVLILFQHLLCLCEDFWINEREVLSNPEELLILFRRTWFLTLDAGDGIPNDFRFSPGPNPDVFRVLENAQDIASGPF